MAGATSVRVDGINTVVRQMQRLGVEAEDLKGAFQRVGAKAEGHAQSIAPKRSGALAASVRQSKRKNSVYLYAGYNSNRLPYAAVIHFGWPSRNIEAQPFMYRTVQVWGPWAVGEIEREMNTLIRKLDLDG